MRENEFTETDCVKLFKQASSVEVLIKAPDRVAKVAADIAEHFQAHVAHKASGVGSGLPHRNVRGLQA